MEPIVTALSDARAVGKVAQLKADSLPGNARDAYRVSRAQLGTAAAWKIGGANPWSRAVFNNTEVFVGPLHPHEVQIETDTLSLTGLVSPLGEPEVMLEIADPEAETPEAQFGRMGLGFEIPASVLPEALKPQLMGQIVDRAGAGKLWVSAVQSFDAGRLITPFEADFIHNDAAPVVAQSSNVIDGPLGAAAEFLMLAKRYDLPVAAGQWLATGGLCPAVALAPGDRLQLRAWGQSVQLDFT